MADVARLAGVSHQTVSRVLNTPHAVRLETRERVENAIAELGYRRNMGARALVTRRTHLLGVVVAQSGYFGPAQTSAGIQSAARAQGFGTMVAATHEGTREELSEIVDLFLDHAVEGVVLVAPQRGLFADPQALLTRIPHVVVADGVPDREGMCTVAVDQYAGARLAMDHLFSLGHERIAHLAGPASWFDAAQRERGWRDALDERGLEQQVLLRGDWSGADGFTAGRKLLREALPDGIFVANDLMAQGMLAALSEADVRIPEDLSVVGFDDSPGVAYLRPGLTTVRQPFADLGALCVRVLLDLVEGNRPEPQRIAPELVVRGSTTVSRR